MQIIPVIDLCAGKVVHAVAGKREAYKNIQTPLCHGSEALSIVRALLNIYPFRTLYIADLDAIRDKGNNKELIEEILETHPDLKVWLDAGKSIQAPSDLHNRIRPVIGTETGITGDALNACNSILNPILSLDFSDEGLIGKKSLLDNAQSLPGEIIVMSLGRVGTTRGPDTARLAQIQFAIPGKRLFLAGGVRDEIDLNKLEEMDVAGVLMATALHYGKISLQTLEKYSAV